MNASFFTALQTLATLGVSAAVVFATKGEWLNAGVAGFLGVVAYLAYEKFPSK